MKLHESPLSQICRLPKKSRFKPKTYLDYLQESTYSKTYKKICMDNYRKQSTEVLT